MASCQQQLQARDQNGRSLSYPVTITITLRNGRYVGTYSIPAGRTTTVSLTNGYYYKVSSMSSGWQSSSGAEFRACTGSPRVFVFNVSGGGGSYDTCKQFFFADDQDGNSMPFAVDFTLKKGSSIVGTYTIPAGGSKYVDLDVGSSYTAVPLIDVGNEDEWERANDQSFTACPMNDTTFVYKKKSGDENCSQSLKTKIGGSGRSVTIKLYKEWPGGEWGHVGTITTNSSGDASVELSEGDLFKAEPEKISGHSVSPSEKVFTACTSKIYFNYTEVTGGAPVVTGISWSPNSSHNKISSGSTLTKRGSDGQNHTLKLTSVTGSPLIANLSIDGGTAFPKSEGDTFVFGGKAWQLLSVVCGPECDFIDVAKTTTETRPVASEEVTLGATVNWNDSGANQTTRRVEWWYAAQSDKCMSQSDLDSAWKLFATTDGGTVEHTFSNSQIKFFRVKARNKHGQISEWYGSNGCQPGFFFAPEVAPTGTTPGFDITVTNAAEDNLMVTQAEQIGNTNTWQVGGLCGYWKNAGNGKYLAVKTESTSCSSFDPPVTTCGVRRLLKGKYYAVFRTRMNILIVQGEDVYKLGDGITDVTVSQCYTSLLESSVCGFFNISGSECTAFVAEMYDPVFLASYAHILKDGTDIYGNERDLTVFDHLAMPFAVIGTIAPQVPLGRFISSGGKGMWAGGKKFSKAAVQWMETVSVNIPDICGSGSWSFIDAIVRCDPGSHIDEVMELIESGNYAAAKAKLEKYADADIVGYWPWRSFNQALRSHLDAYGANKVLGRFGYEGAVIDDVMKGAAKSSPPGGIDDALKQSDILRGGVQNTVGASSRMVAKWRKGKQSEAREIADQLVNVCDNAPKIIREMSPDQLIDFRRNLAEVIGDTRADKAIDDALGVVGDFVSKYKKILIDFLKINKPLSKGDVQAILGGGTDDFLALSHSLGSDFSAVMSKLNRGTDYQKSLASAFSSTDLAGNFGSVRDFKLFLGSNKAKHLAATKTGSPTTVSTAIDTLNDTIVDSKELQRVAGRDVGDNLYDANKRIQQSSSTNRMSDSVIDSSNGFRGAVRQEFNYLRDEVKKEKMHLLVLFGLGFSGAVLTGLYLLTSGRNPESFEQSAHTQKMTTAYWKCHHADKAKLWDDLETFIEQYEMIVAAARKDLRDHAAALRRDETYDEFASIIDDHEFNINDFKARLAASSGKSGTIRCVGNMKGFGVQLDGTGDLHPDYNTKSVTINDVSVGKHTVLFLKSGYTSCEKDATVRAGKVTTVSCSFIEETCKRPVPKIEAEQDDKDQNRFVFTGSAKTDSKITRWTWDFGDGKKAYTKNTSHRYYATGKYTVQLTVEDACGTGTATKTVTVGACQKPVPSFTYTPSDPLDGQTVSFKGSAKTGTDITNWTWDFGDGKRAYTRNASHSYKYPKKYTVELTVEDDCGFGSVSKSVIVDEGQCTDWVTGAMITKDIASPCVGDTIKLKGHASSDSAIKTWKWTLPDGSYKYGQEISVKPTAMGYYTVKLEVTNVCGKSDNDTLKMWIAEKGGGKKTSVTIKFPKDGMVNW